MCLKEERELEVTTGKHSPLWCCESYNDAEELSPKVGGRDMPGDKTCRAGVEENKGGE